MELKSYQAAKIENLRVHGRSGNKWEDGIPLFWTGASVEVNVTGSQLWLTYECRGAVNGDYMRFEIDGAEISRFMMEEGVHRVCVFMGFGYEDVKNVRIYREMQASHVAILIKELHTDGAFLPLPKRPYKIEVVGDSVTSGEGLAGAQSLINWIPTVFSSRDNYALRIAKALDADYSIVSQSGYGVYCSWDNNLLCSIPRYYEQICGMIATPEVLALGGGEKHDFTKDIADIVIVNLGANDASSFANEGWTDKDGVVHKMRLDEDGKPRQEDAALVYHAVYDFCTKIRTLRPACTILWCYGMLNERLNDTIVGAVKQYAADYKDAKIHTVMLPQTDASLHGARLHPGPIAHKMYAETILKKIQEVL